MLGDFRKFILRGNVIDLAVAVIIGAAFGAVVTAFIKDLITPLIAAIGGKPNFDNLFFTVNHSQFLYGAFINALITFVVLAEAATDEPNRLVCAGIGLAIPRSHPYGYIAEHHGYGMSEKKTEDLVEDLAATMLATTLGIPFDPNQAWDEREQQYKLTGEIVKTRAVVQTAEGDKTGLWTSVIAAAVFILDPSSNGVAPADGKTASDIKTPAAAASGSGSLLNPK